MPHHRLLPHRPDPSPTIARPFTSSPLIFEPLERRELLSAGLPTIISASADNRGLAVLTASCDLVSNSVNPNSVRVFTAGADGLLGTPDDTLQGRSVNYDAASRQIRINASLPPNTRYRVTLDSSLIRGTNGLRLDGEFNSSSSPSGDGIQGGDFQFFTRLPVSEEIVRFNTLSGLIDIRLFRSAAPLSVQNFLNFANSGAYDSTFFHRSVSNFVIQAGGFTAAPGFPAIPTNQPVPNEFGRSNTRGTLAYAKFGSDPDSATSQFFFNLANNGANLDNQNGGFTVFAQVTNAQGLSVMDALAAFQKVNAAAANSAFNEIPVLDPAAFNSSGLQPSNLVAFSRVALLMDVTADANQQPPLQGAVDITDPRSAAVVRLFDMNGSGLLNASDFVSVKFSNGGAVSRITLLEPASPIRIGIQILGASSLGTIVDLRTSADADIAFIVSDLSASSIRLTQRLSGTNLNGFVFPGGFTLPDDIDADGDASDNTSIYFAQGFLTTLDARAGFSGDVVLPGGLGALRAAGPVSNADFSIGIPDDAFAGTVFSLASVTDSALRAAGPIRSISASEWLDSGGTHEIIRAASLRTLSIRGAANASGNFEAGLDLFTSLGAIPTLGSATITGGLFRSAWMTAGAVGPITVGGEISQWSLDVAGDARNIRAASLTAVDLLFAGRFGALRAAAWNGGRFEADTAQSISISGDFAADVQLNNSAQQRIALRTLSVKGDFHGGDFTVVRGDASSISVTGSVRDLNVSMRNGALPSISLGEVRDSTLSIFGAVRSLKAVRWDGGTIGGRSFDSIAITGDARRGVPGDVSVTETRSDNIAAFSLQNGGTYTGNLVAGSVGKLQITGDARNGLFSVGRSNIGTGPAIGILRIAGVMDAVDLRTQNGLGAISIGAMLNSGIFVGSSTTTGLPDSIGTINPAAAIDLIRVEGRTGEFFSFTNSFIVAGRITSGLITQPQIDNFGRPFGLAAQTVGMVGVRVGAQTTIFTSNSSPRAFSDFQFRLGFALPA